MKSSQERLAKRGYLDKSATVDYKLPSAAKLDLLGSRIPCDRTLGARLLQMESSFVADKLVAALKKETKLYTKLELCKTLNIHKIDAIPLLISELGKIGKNQHACVPAKAFGKDNFPLPRDIVARTLANIGADALPALINVLEKGSGRQVSEAVDAIGYICYYQHQPIVYKRLLNCYSRHKQEKLICWKIFRAMSGLPESLPFLQQALDNCTDQRIKTEIARSIRLIKKRNID